MISIALFGPTLVSFVLCLVVMRLGIKDAPDGGRKTQAAPVPSAGGLAVLATALAFYFALASPNVAGFVPLILLVAAAALVGLVDDVRGLQARYKFGLSGLMCVLAAAYGPHLETFYLPGGPDGGWPLPAWIAILGAALWLFVIINGTNFMDGANGLAMGSAASMLYPTALMLFPHAWFSADSALPGTMVVLSVLTAQAILGFLFWNLRGKLYAGDVGALGAGAVIAVSGLVLARTYSVWVPATLTLPFLVDILLTMAWRARQGGNLFHPHRDHAYQLFLRAGWPHWCVALLWWGFCIVCGVAPVVAIDASTPSDATAFWIFITLCTTGSALWFWQRAVIGGRLKRDGL